MKTKVGLLGGTFNPVHKGHVELGLNILDAYRLDKVMYIMAARPPHKKNMQMVSPQLRWKMLNRALEPYPKLEPCDIEMKRPIDSWTIDTIDELRQKYPEYHYYFISGSEGFLKIRTWKNYKKLLTMISFIVVIRNKTHRSAVLQLVMDEGMIPCTELPGREDADTGALQENDDRGGVYLYSYFSENIDVSSTLIRQRVKTSKYDHIESLVDLEVKKIMEENKLYEK
jgi:nicotinate-nucleotide adenylyltransferase